MNDIELNDIELNDIEPNDLEPGDAGNWIGRNGWLIAAIWLVFLVFPFATVLTDDDLGTAATVAGSIGLIVFAAVYVDGFRRQHRADSETVGMASGRRFSGRIHMALLIAIGLVLYPVVGPATLGVVSFVVAFAIFHFGRRVGAAALAGGLAVAAIVLFAADVFDELGFMLVIIAAVGVAAMMISSFEDTQVRQAELRTQLALSDERNRVARDVHDVLGHSLTAVIIKAELCQKLLDGIDPDDERERVAVATCREQLGELRSVSRSALAEIRSTVGGLRAANLSDEVTVARTVLADGGVALSVTGEVADVPEQHRPLLAWVVREAVTNIVRHAGASQCRIEFGTGPTDSPVALRVSDDGVGFASPGPAGLADARPAGPAGGNGLRGARERVEAAGGELLIRSDDGTALEVVFP